MRRPTEEQLLNLLKDIESGKVNVELDAKASLEAKADENGIYYFNTSNKWTIGIFVDCGKFDYIDSMRHGGAIVNYGKLNKCYPKVVKYANRFRDEKLAKKVWGIEAKIFAGV